MIAYRPNAVGPDNGAMVEISGGIFRTPLSLLHVPRVRLLCDMAFQPHLRIDALVKLAPVLACEAQAANLMDLRTCSQIL